MVNWGGIASLDLTSITITQEDFHVRLSHNACISDLLATCHNWPHTVSRQEASIQPEALALSNPCDRHVNSLQRDIVATQEQASHWLLGDFLTTVSNPTSRQEASGQACPPAVSHPPW